MSTEAVELRAADCGSTAWIWIDCSSGGNVASPSRFRSCPNYQVPLCGTDPTRGGHSNRRRRVDHVPLLKPTSIVREGTGDGGVPGPGVASRSVLAASTPLTNWASASHCSSQDPEGSSAEVAGLPSAFCLLPSAFCLVLTLRHSCPGSGATTRAGVPLVQAFRSGGHEVVCPAPRPLGPSLNIRAAIANSPARTAANRRSRRTRSRRHGSVRSEPRVHRNGYGAAARTGEKG